MIFVRIVVALRSAPGFPPARERRYGVGNDVGGWRGDGGRFGCQGGSHADGVGVVGRFSVSPWIKGSGRRGVWGKGKMSGSAGGRTYGHVGIHTIGRKRRWQGGLSKGGGRMIAVFHSHQRPSAVRGLKREWHKYYASYPPHTANATKYINSTITMLEKASNLNGVR